jgi:hypothetical protein
VESMIKSTFEIAKNSFNVIIVGKTRIMHIEADLLDRVGEFRSCKTKIL